jgi:hypothetical protein
MIAAEARMSVNLEKKYCYSGEKIKVKFKMVNTRCLNGVEKYEISI